MSISPAVDFRFDPEDGLFQLGGAASRFKHNLAAIVLLKKLEAESLEPGNLTRDEQQTLARYTGWGDSDVLEHAFPNGAYSYCRPAEELVGLLSSEETKTLLASSLNAYYTSCR